MTKKSPIIREVTIGPCRLIQGDCLEVLPLLGKVDAVVTDPPYGIGFSGCNASTRDWDGFDGDDGSLDLRPILAMDCAVVAFGANCYPEQLPHRGRWLCWDKRTVDGASDAMLGRPFELAWCNRRSGFDKIVRVLHGGVVNADGGKRVHPTQKPVAVMLAAINWGCGASRIILDPFMGSGTTGVACIKAGRQFIGIEKEPKYFDIAVSRIRKEYREEQRRFIPSAKIVRSKPEGFLKEESTKSKKPKR